MRSENGRKSVEQQLQEFLAENTRLTSEVANLKAQLKKAGIKVTESTGARRTEIHEYNDEEINLSESFQGLGLPKEAAEYAAKK